MHLKDDKISLLCTSNSKSFACGHGNKPQLNQATAPLILFESVMDPRGEGNKADWSKNLNGRNRYTVSCSSYHLYLPLDTCNTG